MGQDEPIKSNYLKLYLSQYLIFLIVNKNYFEFQFVIGRGGFGKVWQVVMKKK